MDIGLLVGVLIGTLVFLFALPGVIHFSTWWIHAFHEASEGLEKEIRDACGKENH